MIRRCCLCVALLLLGVATTPAQNPKGGVQPLDGEAIAAIWKERQEKVKTARFEVTRTTFYSAGFFTRVMPPIFWLTNEEMQQGRETKINLLVPPTDYKVVTQERFVMDGMKIRYDHTSTQVRHTSANKDLYQRNHQTGYDGLYYREIYQEQGNGAPSRGVLQKGNVYPDANLVALSSLLTTFRGGNRKLCFVSPLDFICTGRRAIINDYECIEYQLGKADNVTYFWLSPSQDWVVARIEQSQKSTKKTQTRQYQLDSQFGWIPKKWDYVATFGDSHTTDQFEVTAYSMNTTTEHSEFALKFTSGTELYHEDVPGGVVGKVQENGTIVPNDGRPAYDLPGKDTQRQSRYWRFVLFALSLLLLSIVVVRAVRRYRRQTSLSSQSPN